MDKMSWGELEDGTLVRMKNGKPMFMEHNWKKIKGWKGYQCTICGKKEMELIKIENGIWTPNKKFKEIKKWQTQ